MTLDADTETLLAFQERVKTRRWSQRTGLTAALTLLAALPDHELDRVCGEAQRAE